MTVIVEVPIYLGLGWRTLGVGHRSGLPLYGGVNLLSHPLLWFGLAPVGGALLGATAGLLAAEGLVVVGEGVAVGRLARLGRSAVGPAVAVAALANAASLAIGLTLSRL